MSPTKIAVEIESIRLPIIYCIKLFLINSKLNSGSASELLFWTKGSPASIDKNIIKGISGGNVIWDDMKVRNLFILKKTERVIARKECKPQNGDNPMKIPKAIDFALISLLPSLSKIFSLKNLFSPFRRK